MTVSVPTHKAWVEFKKKYSVPPHAVSGIDMGKELDTYHNGLSRDFKKNATLATALQAKTEKYLKNIAQGKVAKGKFDEFKRQFKAQYVDMAEASAEEMATMGGDVGAFTKRVKAMLEDGKKLKAGTDLATLQHYRQGAVRGTLAAATQVKGFDPATLVHLWKPIDDVINHLGGDSLPATLDKVVHLIEVTIPKTIEEVTKEGLKLT
jgi:hypothetical protein